jgi:hypothetical protein
MATVIAWLTGLLDCCGVYGFGNLGDFAGANATFFFRVLIFASGSCSGFRVLTPDKGELLRI